MVRRFSLWVAVFISAWLMSSSALAADSWRAWIYDPANGRAVQVNAAGQVIYDRLLPSSFTAPLFSQTISASADGSTIAYTTFDASMSSGQLIVYDAAVDAVIAQKDISGSYGDSFDLLGLRYLFNETGAALAYGYVLGEPTFGWAIDIIDTTGNAIPFQLRYDDKIVMEALGSSDTTGYMPLVQEYANGEVAFTLLNWQTGAATSYESFRWSVTTGMVVKENSLTSTQSDIFRPTREAVMAVLDPRLPNSLSLMEFPFQLNTLQVYDPRTNTTFPFVSGATADFIAPRFIQGGARILAGQYNALDSAATTPTWMIYERSGNLVGTVPIIVADLQSLAGTATGFIYLTLTTTGQWVLAQADTRSGLSTGQVVWTLPAGMEARIAWVMDPANEVAGIYPNWAQLAPPTSTSQVLTPTTLPIPTAISRTSQLTVGTVVIINTTEGDSLNMRSGPGLSFAAIARVGNNTSATVIEGPRSMDGYIWWRIRLSNNQEGWVVDEADGVQTLLPVQ